MNIRLNSINEKNISIKTVAVQVVIGNEYKNSNEEALERDQAGVPCMQTRLAIYFLLILY